ncbi:unnamed protein product [Phytophthora fragariaefolia]|uniref:Unnamed protein product n=1 Tax=Phytophthora fragariaefolia TaxID=1490495 RepID=A0A9W7DBZ7_9STRA|nr:unnamed protein product [Phytophthora fragariaefolia]
MVGMALEPARRRFHPIFGRRHHWCDGGKQRWFNESHPVFQLKPSKMAAHADNLAMPEASCRLGLCSLAEKLALSSSGCFDFRDHASHLGVDVAGDWVIETEGFNGLCLRRAQPPSRRTGTPGGCQHDRAARSGSHGVGA